ncbi:hypothetical protein BGY98DRAFT_323904 [Russula aff. rugulosa BPL654]|nr:hypothetical protein BGY98DRAFT_323904 [Russula aff. rugulosa BPL654]
MTSHITSHLLFILHRPAAPPPIRLQAVLALGDVLAIVPRHLAAASSDPQATPSVQCRVLAVLAQQLTLGGLASSSAAWALRRCTRFCKHQVCYSSTIRVCRPALSGPVS